MASSDMLRAVSRTVLVMVIALVGVSAGSQTARAAFMVQPPPTQGVGHVTPIKLGPPSAMAASCAVRAPDGECLGARWIRALDCECPGRRRRHLPPRSIAASFYTASQCMVVGPDGNLWYPTNGGQVARYDTTTHIEQLFNTPTPASRPIEIVSS